MFLCEFVHALYLAKLTSLTKCEYKFRYILPRPTLRGKLNLGLMVTYLTHIHLKKKSRQRRQFLRLQIQVPLQKSITAIQVRTRFPEQKRSHHGHQQVQLCLKILVQMQTGLNLKLCPNRWATFVLVPFGQVKDC